MLHAIICIIICTWTTSARAMGFVDMAMQPIYDQTTAVFDMAWWAMFNTFICTAFFCIFVVAFLVVGFRTRSVENILRVFAFLFMVLVLLGLAFLRVIHFETHLLWGLACVLVGYWIGTIRARQK